MRPELLDPDLVFEIEKQIEEPVFGYWGNSIETVYKLLPKEYCGFFREI